MRVHSFGIGDGCDRELIEKTAIAGRGSYSFATDNIAHLSGQVIEALKKATQPSLKQCDLTWSNKKIQLGEVFRNQHIHSYQILSKEEFEALKLKFTAAEDPITRQPICLEFSASDFELTDMPLFKVAAHEQLSKFTG